MKKFLFLAVVIAGIIVFLGVRRQESEQKEAKVEVLSPSPSPTVTLDSEIILSVTAPANNAVVSASKLVVRGKTKAKAEVFVNDVETVADGAGNFTATLTLDEGENYILVMVNDEEGNFAEQELTVTYDIGE